MTILGTAYVVLASVCLVVGLQHLGAGWRLRDRRVHLLFAGAATAAAVDALVQRRFVLAASPDEFERLFAWSAVSICVFLILLLWFIEARTSAVRRGLLLAETALLFVTAMLDFVLPSGVVATMDVTSVRDAVLPWGETFSRPIGDASPLRLVGDLANIGFLVLLIDTAFRLVRRDRLREARVIGISTLVLSLSVLAIIPMDLGLLDLPSLHPFAFLLIVAMMAWDLVETAARSSELTLEVAAGERRWRQLIESIQLLVVGIDRDGRITLMNPFAERVSGRSSAEMIGRHYLEFVSDDERESVEASVDRGLAGDPESENERVLVAADGGQRIIRWRSVVLRDPGGVPGGLLSVGADVTDRCRSESELRRATAELEATVRELEEVKAKLEEDNVYLKEEIGSRTEHSDIIGSSDALLYVLHKIRQVADTDATVLIQGETGVGKELVAHAIHDSSNRSSGPFLAVNCAALPASLIDSELFGHERGAFTGADRRRKGRFELADGGTLFLDEVAELPLDVQPKLLRALQEKTIERVGGTWTIEVDVRLIAATNRNLEAEVDAGRFRQDLFYRLEVYPITMPPLRDRKDDIEILARHFAKAFAARHRVELTEIPPEVLRRLEGYPWPGNVRELQNVIERAVLNAKNGVLRLVSPLEARNGPDPEPQRPPSRTFRTLDEVQRDHILEVLASCDGQIAGRGGAAQTLGIHPNTLRSRLKKLGISPPK